MSAAEFIGVDWGMTKAHFMLVARDGTLIDDKRAAGIAQIDGASAIESVCFDTVGAWLSANPALPIIMTGTVGSNIGWHKTGYRPTPASIDDLVGGIAAFEARGTQCFIIPGVDTVRLDGATDIMRSEEVQIFGAYDGGETLFCLPGTHSKWAAVTGGKINDFHTAQTGEMLDIMGRHSVLLNPRRPAKAILGEAFQSGVNLARDGVMGLESLMFTVRSQQIVGGLSAQDADSYFAGIIMGCEIKSALAVHTKPDCVTLVGSNELTALYASALAVFKVDTKRVDGDIASLAGLYKIYLKADW